jgi:ABC-type sugar transport system substrate-binding protein
MNAKKSASGRLMLAAAALVLAACATDSVVLTGTARPAISPAEVRIYSQPPAVFEEIAILNASKSSAFTTGGQKTVDKVVEGLKEEAAKIGANGIILEGFSDRQTGAVGSGVGSSSVSSNSAVGVGVGGSLGIYKKTGHGRAIFVPPGSSSPQG